MNVDEQTESVQTEEAKPTDDQAGGEQQSAPVDYEAEATKLGWMPPDAFKGDPKLHIDAETFYTRANEYMPIAKATIKKLTSKVDRMEKDMEKDRAFFSQSEQRAHAKALAEIRAEQEAAVEVGDLAAHRAAAKKLDELEKPSQAVEPDPDARAEAFADWGKANRWYGENEVMRVYADHIGSKMSAKGILTAQDLQAVSDQVKAKFEDVYPDAFGGKTNGVSTKRSAVESPSTPRARANDNSAASLTSEERRQGQRFVEMGLFKKLDDYAKELRSNG